MHNTKKLLGITLTFGLIGCGLFSPPASKVPASTQPPTQNTTDAFHADYGTFLPQGNAPSCSNLSGGSYPYSTGGPAWRQWFFLDDGTTPINYHTFTTQLPSVSNIFLEKYPVQPTGNLGDPWAVIADYYYRPTLKLTGKLQSDGQDVTDVQIQSFAWSAVSYTNYLKQFETRLHHQSNNYKQFNAQGQVIKDSSGQDRVFTGDQLAYLSVGGKTVRFLPGQTLKVETYLSGSVTYKKELVLAQYRTQAGRVITTPAWVEVMMPYQKLYTKVTTDKYVLYDTSGSRTVATNGVPVVMGTEVRGFTNTPDPDHRFFWRRELYYALPVGIPNNGSSEFHSWLDARKDFVLGWNMSDQKVGKVSVDADGNASVPKELRTVADFNLGTPSFNNPSNCLSKTVSVKPDGQTFDIIGQASPQAPNLTVDPISLDVPFATAGGSVSTSVNAPEGSSFQWSFGDGGTATGDYVNHTYTNPGTYTITVQVTLPNGVTQTKTSKVHVLPEIHKISSQPAYKASLTNKTVPFDLGAPIEGFNYQLDFGDGTSTILNSTTGGKYSKTYPDLGTYVVKLTITDQRATASQGFSQQALGDVVYQAETFRTIWDSRPEAKVLTSPIDKDGMAFGVAGQTTFNFNGSPSTGPTALTYQWDFGDGTTSSSPTPSKVFTKGGLYRVILTVTTTNKLSDQYVTFVKVRDPEAFVVMGARYGSTALSMAAGDLPEVPRQQGIQPQANLSFTDAFPYVLFNDGSSMGVKLQGFNFYSRQADGVSRRYSYCDSFQIRMTNGASSLNLGATAIDPDLTGTACSGATTDFPILSRVNPVYVTMLSTNAVIDYKVSTFQGLRVPKVFIQILPDHLIEGKLASPTLEEYTAPVAGQNTLIMNVRIRKSEMGSSIRFKVPVYAVDAAGALISTANGRFNAKFRGANFTSDCNDCAMVDGKAYITLTLNPASFSVKSGGTALDLSQISTYADANCGSNSLSTVPHGGLLSNCATVTTSNVTPSGTVAIVAYPYPLTQKALGAANKVAIGNTPEEQAAIEKNSWYVPWTTLKLVWSVIPILGDGTDLLSELYNTYFTQQGGDVVLATLASGGLILDITTGGLGDFTTGLKVGYKASQAATGFVADLLKGDIEALLAGTKSLKATVQGLQSNYLSYSRIFFRGGFPAFISVDRLAKSLSTLPCSVASINYFSKQAWCDPQIIKKLVEDIADNAFENGVSQTRLLNALKQICCDIDGGAHILGADELIQKLSTKMDKSGVNGALAVAEFADSLRKAGHKIIKIPGKADQIKISGGRLSEPDLHIIDINGIERFIEIKLRGRIDKSQESILKEMSAIEGVRPSFMAYGMEEDYIYLDKLRCAGIDVLSAVGEILNLTPKTNYKCPGES